MIEMPLRIALARKNKGLSQTQLASVLGVSRGACGQWERGITVPSVVNLSKLAWHLDIRFEWIATGRGEMLYDVSGQSSEVLHHDVISLDQKGMLEVYSALPVAQKEALLGFLKTLK